jgi:hypothetical protein
MAAFDALFRRFGVPTLEYFFGKKDAAVFLILPDNSRAGPFRAICGMVDMQEADNDEGNGLRYVLIVQFPRQQGLPFWTSGFHRGTAVEIDGQRWTLDLVETVSEALATTRLVRRATTEAARPGYRRK